MIQHLALLSVHRIVLFASFSIGFFFFGRKFYYNHGGCSRDLVYVLCLTDGVVGISCIYTNLSMGLQIVLSR